FTNSNGGGLSLTDTEGLTVTAAVDAGSDNLALHVTGDLGVGANLTAGKAATLDVSGAIGQTAGTISATDVALNAGGTISQSGGATIGATGTLSGTSTGGTTLDDTNRVANLGSFTNTGTGGFSLTDAEGLTITAAVAAGSDNLALHVTGDLGVGGNLIAGQAVNLAASGSINQTAGTISATDVALGAGGTVGQSGGATISATGTLTGTSIGGATLDDANQIAALGNFSNTGPGGFSLTDAEGLTVTGAVTSGGGALSLTVAGPELAISGSLNSGAGTTTIAAQSGTTLVAGATDGNATGPVLLITDASLGQITAAALVLDTTGAADIFVNGVGLHPTLNGVTLNSGSDVTFDTTGSSFASSLAANGADITVAGNLSAGTALALNASAAISQTGGAVTSPLVTLSAGTAITQSGGTISGTTAVLDAGTTISQSGGATINVGLLSGHSTGGTSLNDANLVDNLTGFTNAGVGGFSLADAKSLNVSGPVAAGTGDLAFQVTGALTTAADLTAGGTVALSATGPGVAITQISGTIHGASVSLDTTGAISQTGGAISAADVALDAGTTITQTGGSIAAGTLQGSSDGDTTLANPANTVATLGTFNVSGGSV